MKIKPVSFFLSCLLTLTIMACSDKPSVIFCGTPHNDLYPVLQKDAGWGAWGTLTGWTQSWIVATQVLAAKDENYWDLTSKSSIKTHMPSTVEVMFGGRVKEKSSTVK